MLEYYEYLKRLREKDYLEMERVDSNIGSGDMKGYRVSLCRHGHRKKILYENRTKAVKREKSNIVYDHWSLEKILLQAREGNGEFKDVFVEWDSCRHYDDDHCYSLVDDTLKHWAEKRIWQEAKIRTPDLMGDSEFDLKLD